MSTTLLGSGWPFPIATKGDPMGRLEFLAGAEKIRQSIWLIMSTSAGERQMLPQFGCGIHDLVFEPNTAALRGVIRGKVLDALARWEPRIDVLDVRVEAPTEALNYLLIRVDYRIRADNSFYNLVYPFSVTEGPG